MVGSITKIKVKKNLLGYEPNIKGPWYLISEFQIFWYFRLVNSYSINLIMNISNSDLV